MPDEEKITGERIEQAWDEHGRGLLTAAYHKLCGYAPNGRRAIGFATFARQVDLAMRSESLDFPHQFRPMLRAAVLEVVAELVPGLVKAELEPVRKAFAELRREIAEMKKAAVGKPTTFRVQTPAQAIPVGK